MTTPRIILPGPILIFHKVYGAVYRVLVQFCVLLACSVILGWPASAYAHGTVVDLAEVGAIQIEARFDDGTPMAEAQVAIYAPTDRATPWLTGQADENGYFVFVPDRSLTGQWDIQLRTSGHGDWVYVDIADGAVAELRSSGGGLTWAQIALMSAAVIWGFVGTALYFMGEKKEQDVLVTTP